MQYAVGRLHFDTVEESANYARSVVQAETSKLSLGRRIALWGPGTPGDGVTELSTAHLLNPLSSWLTGDVFGDSKFSSSFGDWSLDAANVGSGTKAQLAELMGGRVTVNSTPGQGSTFSVQIKAPKAEPDPKDCSEEQLIETDFYRQHLEGKKILVAEDNEMNRIVLEMSLQPFNLDLTFALNGEEAITKWCEGHYEAILMDMQMPVMDGLTATGHIRDEEKKRNLPRTPILALTADAVDDHLDRLLKNGIDERITKPISLEELADALIHHLCPHEAKKAHS